MRKLGLLTIIVFTTLFSFSQSVVQRSYDVVTVEDWRLMGGHNFFIPRYLDTTAANLQKGIDSAGAIIYTYDNVMWIRYSSPKKWAQVGAYLAGNFWNILGNAGTVDGTNFIGTTNNVPFNIRVNNQKSGRIESSLSTANTFYGYQSGIINTGLYNTTDGYKTLFSNTTGSGNTAMGFHSLAQNTTGTFNTGIGCLTLHDAAATTGNTAVGALAVQVTTIGNYNTGVGYEALYNNTTGNNNIAVGDSALYTNITGYNNTAIGTKANVGSNNLHNATAIGANAIVGQSNSMSLMDTTAPIGVGIGTAYPTNMLDIQGYDPLRLRNLNYGSPFDSLLNADDNGVVHKIAVSDIVQPAWLLGGNNSTNPPTDFLGTIDDVPLVLKVNSAMSGYISAGTSNTSLGYQSFLSNGAGTNNSALGSLALGQNTSGNTNTAVGVSALFNNIDGSDNTAIGSNADVITGSLTNSTAIGSHALIGISNGISFGDSTLGTKSGFGTSYPTNIVDIQGANPLRLRTLSSGSSNDSVLTANSTGVVKWRNASSFGTTYSGVYPIIVSGSNISADTGRYTTQIVTGYDLNKVRDSVQTNVALKVNISDTSLMLSHYLRSSDATATYVPLTRTISTTAPITGGGDLSANRTFAINDAVADGSTKGAATFTASDFNSSSGNISIDYTNGQAASASNKGFLTSSDWTTFNNKQSTLSAILPLSITSNTISMPKASSTDSGWVSTTAQTFSGTKTFGTGSGGVKLIDVAVDNLSVNFFSNNSGFGLKSGGDINFYINGTRTYEVGASGMSFKKNTAATAYVDIAAGTATASTSPLKFAVAGAVLNTTAEIGAVEVLKNRLYYTDSSATRYIIHAGGTPTIAAGVGAGTSPTISITGIDEDGYISVTTGTLPTLSAVVGTITFSSAYGATPKCIIISPANSNAALLSGVTAVFVDQAGISSTTWAITSGTTALTAATTYLFYYSVKQ